MNLYIPKPGDVIQLSRDWTFQLYKEPRNETLFVHAGLMKAGEGRDLSVFMSPIMQAHSYTLKAGSRLRFDRLYIRKGLPDYNSATFFLLGEKATMICYYTKKAQTRAVRFWARLDDVNRIEFEPLDEKE